MSTPTLADAARLKGRKRARSAQGKRGRRSPCSVIRERAGHSFHELSPYLSSAWVEDSILFPVLQLRKLRRGPERTSPNHPAGQDWPRVSSGPWLSLTSRRPPVQAGGPPRTHATARTRGAWDVCTATPGVCGPARAGAQLTLALIPGCSLRFQEFPKISRPRTGVQEGRVTTGSQASTADLDPTPAGNQSHRKQGSVRPPAARSQNARHSGQLGRQRSGMLEPGLAAEARALPRGAATAPLSPRALCPPGTAPAWGRGACLIPLRVTRVLTTLPLAGCLLRDLASGQND